ncbi:hypothetical protein [Candidatus Protochlamydia phocaeensis]|uniref:hypothetical protein n=1 Tax=Candidatus Protochlamydia phocaeensis TaxID=1414722 RepID=UPI0008385D28|nr:hypothetical protein [Candidatus Protochlamydia phocaeensis]
MCCPLQRMPSHFILTDINPEPSTQHGTIYHCRGYVDFSPRTLADRILLTFQRLELAEKISEIADEFFHLFGSLLKQHANLMVYQTFRNLHHGAHEIEHFLHSFCFLGDLCRAWNWKTQFLEYTDEQRIQLDYIRTSARVCHAVSHFFSTLTFLSEHQLCRLGRFEHIVKYHSLLSTVGYGLWTISLIWRCCQRQRQAHLASDLAIHAGGFFFEGLEVSKTFNALAAYTSIINKVKAVAGIIHAWSVAYRLMPGNREELQGQFRRTAEGCIIPNEMHTHHDHNHCHHEHHHHNHCESA